MQIRIAKYSFRFSLLVNFVKRKHYEQSYLNSSNIPIFGDSGLVFGFYFFFLNKKQIESEICMLPLFVSI